MGPNGRQLRNDVVVTVVATAPSDRAGVGQRKVKKPPCNSLFKHDLTRPTLAPRKHVLTCTNRTELVIHDPHRPDGPSHLIRVRSMHQACLWLLSYTAPLRHAPNRSSTSFTLGQPDSGNGAVGRHATFSRRATIHECGG
jgi:hypothetical protein